MTTGEIRLVDLARSIAVDLFTDGSSLTPADRLIHSHTRDRVLDRNRGGWGLDAMADRIAAKLVAASVTPAAAEPIESPAAAREQLERLLAWGESQYRQHREAGKGEASEAMCLALGDLASFSKAIREIFGH